jgi:antitoxin ParD1/3/4
MTVNLSPEMEALIQKRIESGAYSTPEEVVQRALESFSEEDDWMSENREEVSAMIEEGWQAARRGEFSDEETVRREMEEYKQEWLKQHRSA